MVYLSHVKRYRVNLRKVSPVISWVGDRRAGASRRLFCRIESINSPTDRDGDRGRVRHHVAQGGAVLTRASPTTCRDGCSATPSRWPARRCFRGSMAGLHSPLSTLHERPHGRPRMTRGRCGIMRLLENSPLLGLKPFLRYIRLLIPGACASALRGRPRNWARLR